uniref:Uncharacterized protein n=1 Tax=Timema monikensis TaxID=170555 RepID=A0A7R9EG96_9NEOP|nr:unnamed protein product [Timema monikensis]
MPNWLSLLTVVDAAAGRPRFTKGPVNVEEEVRILRRQLENRWAPPPVDETIKKILLGRPFSLELYRSLALKTELLDAAINMGDGNAILGVKGSKKVSHTYRGGMCLALKKLQFGCEHASREQSQSPQVPTHGTSMKPNKLKRDLVSNTASRQENRVDEATDSVKDAHLVTYVRYINNRSVQEDLLFCKPLPGIASAEGVFKILDDLLTASEMKGENCAPAMSGERSGLQALMKQFQLAVQATHNPQRRIQKLKACLNNHFLATDKDRQLVENYVKLLEWQLSMAGTDAELCKTLVGQSVLGSLSHACRHHWGEPRGTSGSPLTLSSQQGVSARHFQWTVLNVRASLQAWDDIDGLFITKSWLGGQKVKSVVLMERVVEQLHRHRAPYEVLLKYLSLIDNLDKRMAVARRIKCHKAVIDVFVLQRDRQALTHYKASLLTQSEDYFYAENALRATGPGLDLADVHSSGDVCCLNTGLIGRVGWGRKKIGGKVPATLVAVGHEEDPATQQNGRIEWELLVVHLELLYSKICGHYQ